MLRGRDSSCSSRATNLGISQRRAVRFIKWTREIAASAHMTTFEEGLGRCMYVAGAFENERPSCTSFSSSLSPHTHTPPTWLGLFLSPCSCLLFSVMLQPRLRRCGTSRAHLTLTRPRRRPELTHRPVSETRTGIVGWLLVLDRHDIPAPKKTNISVLVRSGHGSLRRGDRPALIISTLEAPAALVTLKTFSSEEQTRHNAHRAQVDNGDAAALDPALEIRDRDEETEEKKTLGTLAWCRPIVIFVGWTYVAHFWWGRSITSGGDCLRKRGPTQR